MNIPAFSGDRIEEAREALGTVMTGVLCARHGDRAGAVATYRGRHPDPEDLVSRLRRPDAQIPFANL